MSPRITVIVTLFGAALSLLSGCVDDPTSCAEKLACANQGKQIISLCCTELSEETASCWYEVPDGTTFECEPVEDAMNVGPACEQAVVDMNAYCSD